MSIDVRQLSILALAALYAVQSVPSAVLRHALPQLSSQNVSTTRIGLLQGTQGFLWLGKFFLLTNSTIATRSGAVASLFTGLICFVVVSLIFVLQSESTHSQNLVWLDSGPSILSLLCAGLVFATVQDIGVDALKLKWLGAFRSPSMTSAGAFLELVCAALPSVLLAFHPKLNTQLSLVIAALCTFAFVATLYTETHFSTTVTTSDRPSKTQPNFYVFTLSFFTSQMHRISRTLACFVFLYKSAEIMLDAMWVPFLVRQVGVSPTLLSRSLSITHALRIGGAILGSWIFCRFPAPFAAVRITSRLQSVSVLARACLMLVWMCFYAADDANQKDLRFVHEHAQVVRVIVWAVFAWDNFFGTALSTAMVSTIDQYATTNLESATAANLESSTPKISREALKDTRTQQRQTHQQGQHSDQAQFIGLYLRSAYNVSLFLFSLLAGMISEHASFTVFACVCLVLMVCVWTFVNLVERSLTNKYDKYE